MRKNRKCRLCPTMIYPDSVTGMCAPCLRVERAAATPSARLEADRKIKATAHELGELRRKYDEALRQLERNEKMLTAMGVLGDSIDLFKIEPKLPSGTAEAVPVVVCSDWHIDETVTLAQSNGLNQFNRPVCDARVSRLFRSSLNLIKNHLATGVAVKQVMAPLLGDFINNHLHDEAIETNNLLPMNAVIQAEQYLASGIQFWLDNSPYDFFFPTKSGNHGRVTKKTRFATENGHSLEYLMYVHLAAYFRNEPRVRFQINDGYHDYVDVYDKTLRLHHGHQIKYQGGIGGLFIPTYKKIAAWDTAREADIDVFGHFHTSRDGGKFYSNGSLVGFNSYAVSIGAPYEPPQQTLFLVDKKRGATCRWPILLETA